MRGADTARSALARARRELRNRRLLAHARRELTPPPPAAFAGYGAGALVLPPARVESPDCIRLGERAIVHEHAWLCVQRRPGLPPPLLEIGAGTSINRFAKIVCHGSVTIGRDVIMADRVYISDVEHEPVADGAPVLTDPRPVTVGDGVFIGVGAVVKPGVSLGAWSYVGASAVVDQDVPAYTLVTGVPARVVRRLDPESGEWRRVSDERG